MSWSPKVSHEDRRSFEAKTKNIHPGFMIKNFGVNKNFVPAAARKEYFPILYLVNRSGTTGAVGFNLESDPIRKEALDTAKTLKKPYTTGLVQRLSQDLYGRQGMIVFMPVFKSLELKGYVACAISVPEFFMATLGSAKGEGIEFTLFDNSPEFGNSVVHTSHPNIEKDSRMDIIKPVILAGRPFSIQFHATDLFIGTQRTWASWFAIVGGFLFSALLGGFLLIITGKQILIQNAHDELEIKIQERTAELDQAQEIAKIGSWSWLVKTREVLWSRELYEIYGLEPFSRKMTFESFVAMAHPEDREYIKQKVKFAVEKKEGFEFEHRITAADGEIHCLLCKGRTVLDGKGEIYKMLGTSQDITNRKKLEEELLKARNEAQSASHAKSQFLANMSHEIRTPLGAILGFSEVLKDDLSPAERNQAIDTILRNGQHLVRLINEILDLSKIEAGRIQLEKIEMSLSQLMGDVKALLQPLAADKGLSINLKSTGKIPPLVRTDPTRLRQILINLIGNAVKFSERGYIDVIVSYEKPILKFSIKDTGRGIKEEAVGNLFKPFMQEDASSTRRFGGTGLGLAISKQLAKALGGDLVLAESNKDGSLFEATIYVGEIPEKELAHELSFAPHLLTEEGVQSALSLKGTKVLLVEDNLDIQNLTRRLLEKAGATIDSACNGAEGVEKALHGYYDLVLMDIQMPELDGYQATEHLRHNGYLKPIIALTAHAMKEDIDHCLESGCDGYLSKPIDRKKLIEVVYQRTHTTH
jgi:PAS domain S-box-containing protein